MKRFHLILAAAAAAMLCACSTGNEKTVVIKASGLEVKEGVAEVMGRGNKVLDSIAYSGGSFKLSYVCDIPEEVYVFVKDSTDNIAYMASAYLEPGTFTLNLDQVKEDFHVATVEGSVLDAFGKEFSGYVYGNAVNKESSKLSAESNEAYMKGDKLTVNRLQVSRDSLTRLMVDSVFNYRVKKSREGKMSDSELALEEMARARAVCNLAPSLPLDERIKIAARFPADYAASVPLNNLRNDNEMELKLQVGSPAPDFSLRDTSGKAYSLKDFKGKYVYMNFSASWCGWCKKEIPFIREAYEKTLGEDIVFVTVNMDETREAWLDQIRTEGVTWLCISDLGGMNSELAKSYNIHGIPECDVLDKEGKFLKKDVRGNEMIDFITALFEN